VDLARPKLVASVRAAFVLAALAGAFGACNGPPPSAPSPVIATTPTTVCIGDDYRTRILLDGTQSTPSLTLVPAPFEAGLLTYAWTLGGSAYRIVDGSPTAPKLTVEMAANEPLQVALDVTLPNGGSLTATATVSITLLNEAGVCPLTLASCVAPGVDAGGCPDGSACDAAVTVCLPSDAGDGGGGG
jgi:hypothetical protein